MTDDEREAQIRALLPMVRRIARRVHRVVARSDLDDLMGDGCIGLIRAVDAFDPSRNVPLEHYASRLILGTILNGIRRMDPVSERMRRTIRVADQLRFEFAQERGTLPTPTEMEAHSPAFAHARAEVRRRTPLSLDGPLPNSERIIPDFSADPQLQVVEQVERATIRAAVGALPPRQRAIIRAHYFDEHRLRALAQAMHISPQRVSQLHLLAIKRLREALDDPA